MHTVHLFLFVAVLFSFIAIVIYVYIVNHHITIANATIDKANIVANAGTLWERIDAKLIGWKTIVLAWIAATAQALSYALTTDVVSGWQSLPWSSVFDARVANAITFICALLIPITHAFGMKTAASIPPTDGQA